VGVWVGMGWAGKTMGWVVVWGMGWREKKGAVLAQTGQE